MIDGSTCRVTLLLGPLLLVGAPTVESARAQAPPIEALRVELAADPAEVTVGEPFRSIVRVIPPTGGTVRYSEFAGGDSLQAIRPVTVSSTDDGDAAIYELVAWATGDALEASVLVTLTDPGGRTSERTVRLGLPAVRSVLPERDEAIGPRPAKGLFVPAVSEGIAWWWLLLLLLGALASGMLGYRMLARGRGTVAGEVRTDPRTWALRQLGEIVQGADEDPAEVFRRVSWIVRTYLWRLDDAHGPDLTTTELLLRLRFDGTDRSAVEQLEHLLASSDQVKFAGHRPDPASAERVLEDARSWIDRFPQDREIPLGQEAA